MDKTEQWPVGRLIEAGRIQAHLSKRAAARAAGISEGRWRQIEDGYEVKQGQHFPVRTSPETLVAMAGALGLDAGPILEAAGFDRDAASIPVASHQVVDVTGLSADDIERVRTIVDALRKAEPRK
ncbi:helix-turn-helix transcriptional regulator [Rhodococcus maanshanensis]|uniref:helix-turn-helix domain-containing protein n=1 Tax=Rhodococcus maanshanensis TaxID=183556 RepID=UPI0022B41B9C|nr:helix-turn-helix transcriptional regulator [Rhodococcus maanshanensis]MCZ4557923.1 helix-turn-helix transcriptional regulator [Rhodococcus maanshanensis]